MSVKLETLEFCVEFLEKFELFLKEIRNAAAGFPKKVSPDKHFLIRKCFKT